MVRFWPRPGSFLVSALLGLCLASTGAGFGGMEEAKIAKELLTRNWKILKRALEESGLRKRSTRTKGALFHVAKSLKSINGGKRNALEILEAFQADVRSGQNATALYPTLVRVLNLKDSLLLRKTIRPILADFQERLASYGGQAYNPVFHRLSQLIRNPRAFEPEEKPQPKVAPEPPVAENETPLDLAGLGGGDGCPPVVLPVPPGRPAKNPWMGSCEQCKPLQKRLDEVYDRFVEAGKEEKAREKAHNALLGELEAAALEFRQSLVPLEAEKSVGGVSRDPLTGVTVESRDQGDGTVRVTTTYPDGRSETRVRPRSTSASARKRRVEAAERKLEEASRKEEEARGRVEEASRNLGIRRDQVHALQRERTACLGRCQRSAAPRALGEGVYLFEERVLESLRFSSKEVEVGCEACSAPARKLQAASSASTQASRRARRAAEDFNRRMEATRAALAKETVQVEVPRGQDTPEFLCSLFGPAKAQAMIRARKEGKRGKGGATHVLFRVEIRESPGQMAAILEDQEEAMKKLPEVYSLIEAFRQTEVSLAEAEQALESCEADRCQLGEQVFHLSDPIEEPFFQFDARSECSPCQPAWQELRQSYQRKVNAQRDLYQLARRDLPELEAKLEAERSGVAPTSTRSSSLQERLRKLRARHQGPPAGAASEKVQELRLRIEELRHRKIPTQIRSLRTWTIREQRAREALEECNQSRCQGEQGGDPREIAQRRVGELMRAYEDGNLGALTRLLTRDFEQDRSILENAIRNELRDQTGIRVDFQISQVSRGGGGISVRFSWNRTASDLRSGVSDGTTGRADLFLDGSQEHRIKRLTGQLPFGVRDRDLVEQAGGRRALDMHSRRPVAFEGEAGFGGGGASPFPGSSPATGLGTACNHPPGQAGCPRCGGGDGYPPGFDFSDRDAFLDYHRKRGHRVR